MGVNLEFVRMSLYVTFPIVMFYLANSPHFFKKPKPLKIVETKENAEKFEATLRVMKEVKARKNLHDS